MKKGIIMLFFFLAALSLVTNLVTEAFFIQNVVEVTEKEGKKEADNEPDEDKEKINHGNNELLNLWVFQNNQHLHPPTKILSAALDMEIDPPDTRLCL